MVSTRAGVRAVQKLPWPCLGTAWWTFYGTRVGWEQGVWSVSQYWFDRVRQDNNCMESEMMPIASHSIGMGNN